MAAAKFIRTPGGYFKAAAQWWNSQLMVSALTGDNRQCHPAVVKAITSNPAWLRIAPTLLQAADTGITGFYVREDKVPPEVKDLAKKINEVIRDHAAHASGERVAVAQESVLEDIVRSLEFVHTSGDKEFTLPDHLESLGTQSWLDITVGALAVLANGGVLIADEIDTSLHPQLVRLIVSLFSDPEINNAGAQLVFSSHDVTLLGKYPDSALDKNQVWIVDKFDSYSQLTQLAQFTDAREQHNFEQRYIRGLYGGVPNIDKPAIKDLLLGLRNPEAQADVVQEPPI